MEEKKGIFGGALGRMILPGIILQSVLIGGGYATGREIVEYGAKFGAMGWLSGLATFVGFALVAILSFELIRLYKVYDFKSFLKELIGPLYHVFDLVYLLFMVIIIAVMSSATGAVVEQMTGLNYWYGVGAITVIVGVLNYYGEKIISYFETIGTVLLYIGYISFSVLVISHGGAIFPRSWHPAIIPLCPMPLWELPFGQAFSTWPITWWFFRHPSSPSRPRRAARTPLSAASLQACS